jgi:hypothetical protein
MPVCSVCCALHRLDSFPRSRSPGFIILDCSNDHHDNTSLNDLAGYQVYYGLAPRFYDVAVDVGLATSAVLSDLEAGRTYYFAVTAYDTSGNESVFSTEVPYAIPLTDNACGFANLALCAAASASSVWSAG